MEEDALELLVSIAMSTSLRYAIQLITTSNIVALKRKKGTVAVQDLRRVYEIFADVKRSI